jgi:hypothetical protein
MLTVTRLLCARANSVRSREPGLISNGFEDVDGSLRGPPCTQWAAREQNDTGQHQ